MRRIVRWLAVLGALAAVPAAQAQRDGFSSDPQIRAIQDDLAEQCDRQGMQPRFEPGFLESVDADHDAARDDVMLFAARFSCVRDGDPHPTPVCRFERRCPQWLLIGTPSGLQQVWSGEQPALFVLDDGDLINLEVECDFRGCNAVVWHDGQFKPVNRARR